MIKIGRKIGHTPQSGIMEETENAEDSFYL